MIGLLLGILIVLLVGCFALSSLITMSLWVGIRLSYLENLGLGFWHYFPKSHKDIVDTIRFGGREGRMCAVSAALTVVSFLLLALTTLLSPK